MTGYVRWGQAGWRGWIAAGTAIEPEACLAAAAGGTGRVSRHARTTRLETPAGAVFVKMYPAPAGRRAWRAFIMARALAANGFDAPAVALVARRAREGLLAMLDVGGDDLLAAVARWQGGGSPARRAKRTFLRALGAEIARLHRAGFVHGDLVPPNVRVRDGRFVFLDNDRTRRWIGVPIGARRNLVQLGRFVVPGVTLTDRTRVLHAYAEARGLGRRRRHRLARWVVQKTVARRCAIDRISAEVASHAGFRELMRSGGPFDPSGAMERRA
jgi:hypothetical protein